MLHFDLLRTLPVNAVHPQFTPGAHAGLQDSVEALLEPRQGTHNADTLHTAQLPTISLPRLFPTNINQVRCLFLTLGSLK